MAIPKLVKFQLFQDVNGALCVYEGGQTVPFNIKRVFTVSAKAADIRGDHAHKQCTQLLVCVSGKIGVECDDGRAVERFDLCNMGEGLLIPPGVWAKQEYIENGAILMVLCDRVYEAHDYLRDYDEFKKFVGN